MNSNNEYVSKQQINTEFEKLLNWKKYRIFLSKLDHLNLRSNIFDLDTCLRMGLGCETNFKFKEIDNNLLVKCLAYKSRFSYSNIDQFAQFINQMKNEDRIVKNFSNISFLIGKSYLNLKASNYYNEQNNEFVRHTSFKYDLEFMKTSSFVDKKSKGKLSSLDKLVTRISNIQKLKCLLGKKINSKLNTFIYKPKFDKLPKQPIATGNNVIINSSKYIDLNFLSANKR